MVRLIYCVNRREVVSIGEFRRFWNDEHFAELYREYNKVFKTAAIKKSLVLKVPMNIAISERQGMRKPYDGVIEIWWHDAKELVAINETPEAEELRRKIAEYENKFVDKSRSTLFFTEYQE